MKLTIIFLLLFDIHSLLACSCGPISKINKQSIAKARTIFVGRVSKIELTTVHSKKITFQIVENLKTAGIDTAIVYTGEGGGDCGLNIKEGQEWYIFAYEEAGNSWAGFCGRSALLSEHSIPPNPYKQKYYKRAVKTYKKERRRAREEILFIKRKL